MQHFTIKTNNMINIQLENPKEHEIRPHREDPTPLKPQHPEINPGDWEERPTRPNPNIPERDNPNEKPTKPDERDPEILFDII